MRGVFSWFPSLLESRPFIKSESYNVSLQRRALLLGTAFVLTQIATFYTLSLKQVRRVFDLAIKIKEYSKTRNVICSAILVIVQRLHVPEFVLELSLHHALELST